MFVNINAQHTKQPFENICINKFYNILNIYIFKSHTDYILHLIK